jgi:uncharacterized protein HemX
MTESSPPPSKAKQTAQAAAQVIGGVPGTLTALVTALTVGLGAWQSYQDSRATAAASYEALKAASEQNAEGIAKLHADQLEMRSWIQELAARQERQQATVAEAVAPVRVRSRRSGGGSAPVVEKPVTVVAPLLPAEPPPPAPVLAPAPVQTPLPEFETLPK